MTRSSAQAIGSYRLGRTTRERSLNIPHMDTLRIIDHLQQGLPIESLDHFMSASDFSLETIARAVQIPVRTLRRRRKQGRLRPDESDRLYRFAGVFEKCLELFDGNREAAKHWLVSPARALAGHSPLELAETEVGARTVEDLIGQLEHGVFP